MYLSSRCRITFLIFFTLVLVNLFVFYEYLIPPRLTLEEESLPKKIADESDDSSSFNPNSTRILIVSSLFLLSKSKHSKEDYYNWLHQFLGPVTTEVYFYTSPDLVPIVQAARGDGLPITIDTNYDTAFDVPPLKGLEEVYKEMHGLDREHLLHSPELYSVWNAKPFFVDNAVQIMESKGKTYDYVFWNDAGSFRSGHVHKNWPDPSRLHEIWEEGSKLSGTKAEDLLFYPTVYPPYGAKYWKEDTGPIDSDFSEGKHRLFFFLPTLLKSFFQVHSLVAPQVQWLGGHVHSMPITTTT